ncbi:ABC-three component system middle component 7 [Treponema peruense]|uniref:Uncharacterized protein n=1 Tax=Treponema peruense TaxID=2787628 RepID=A0A7T3V502_9SPIR|nr:ABC-three component system middle component 7 [Treponema peruense]QQA00851.1 hypothetical protein IWA51_11445 [Treponema peruense]
MLLPNKTVTYKESIISKFPFILNLLCNTKERKIKIYDLCKKTNKEFESTTDFIQTLDALFALNKIKLDENSGEIVIC